MFFYANAKFNPNLFRFLSIDSLSTELWLTYLYAAFLYI